MRRLVISISILLVAFLGLMPTVAGAEKKPTKSLHRAARDGDIEQVRLLIAKGADVNNALHWAASAGQSDVVELLIDKGADVNAMNKEGRTPLHSAAKQGHKDVVELLIDKGADVNAKNKKGRTPLHLAALGGHKDVGDVLVAKGAAVSTLHFVAFMADLEKIRSFIKGGRDVKAKDKMGRTPLHFAGSKDVAEFLIDNGADVNAKDRQGQTPLHWAARRGHKDVVELLIAKGADVNAKNNSGSTPLHSAASAGQSDVAELLITKGADVNVKHNSFGSTPLHWAASAGQSDVAELLIDNGADVNVKNNSGYTPLHRAASAGQSDVAELLIAKGSNVNAKNNRGWTPLHSAASGGLEASAGHKDVAELLIDKGADVNVKDNSGYTPLYRAASSLIEVSIAGRKDVADLLIARGAVVSSLHVAAFDGDLDKIRSFIRGGADVNAKDEVGRTPLYFAGSKDVVEFLIANGADVNVKDNFFGQTPLHLAARRGDKDVAELLIDKGADVNVKDNYFGQTALHWAAMGGQKDVVALLIDKGADVNPKGMSGWTALHSAAERGHKDVVELLIDKGADANTKDQGGRTPLAAAKAQGCNQIVELLLKHGAVATVEKRAKPTKPPQRQEAKELMVSRTEGIEPGLSELPGTRRLVASGWKASWSPDGTRLVFGKPRGTGLQILNLESRKTTDLISPGKDAAWSPDGRFIAYVYEPRFNRPLTEEVWLIKPTGEPPRKLVDGGFPSWSADGKTVFVNSRRENKILALEVDDPNPEPRVFFDRPQSGYPAVSPDGKRIAFSRRGALVVVDRETGETVLRWPTPGSRGLLPSWSPDGNRIAFGGLGINDPLGVWVLDVKTEKAAQVAKGRYTISEWSKDGAKLAFDFRSWNTSEVWMVETEALATLKWSRPIVLTVPPSAGAKEPTSARPEQKNLLPDTKEKQPSGAEKQLPTQVIDRSSIANIDPLADPNVVKARLKKFQGLEEALKDVEKESEKVITEWISGLTGITPTIVKAVYEQVGAEFEFVRKQAVEEAAEKTTAAIDGVLLSRQERFDKIVEKMQEDTMRRELRESRRTRRPQRRPRGRTGAMDSDYNRRTYPGTMEQNSRRRFPEDMTNRQLPPKVTIKLPFTDPNKVKAKIKTFEGLEKELKTVGRTGVREMRGWTRSQSASSPILAKAVYQQVAAELNFIRKFAIEEAAVKTTVAIDGLLVTRHERFERLAKTMLEEKRKLRRVERRPGRIRTRR